MLRLHSIIGRPDKAHLIEEGMSLALRYFHTLEDWNDQTTTVLSLKQESIECVDSRTVIKLDTLNCKCHRIIGNKIEFMGTCYKKGNCEDGKSYILRGNEIILPIPCSACSPILCKGHEVGACIKMLCHAEFEVTCDAVTGSWIYDKYPEVVRNYAHQYVRASLDGKPFEYEEGNDLIILRGEL